MKHVQCNTTEWIHILLGSGKLTVYGQERKKGKKAPQCSVVNQIEPISTKIRKNWPNYGWWSNTIWPYLTEVRSRKLHVASSSNIWTNGSVISQVLSSSHICHFLKSLLGSTAEEHWKITWNHLFLVNPHPGLMKPRKESGNRSTRFYQSIYIVFDLLNFFVNNIKCNDLLCSCRAQSCSTLNQ